MILGQVQAAAAEAGPAAAVAVQHRGLVVREQVSLLMEGRIVTGACRSSLVVDQQVFVASADS